MRAEEDCPLTIDASFSESSCNRKELDGAVSIHAVERYLGDLANERGWQFRAPDARSGRRVLVVGSGPSGLSAAYHLARLGHDVVVRDNGPLPGGMMRYGIPAYRLPRAERLLLDPSDSSHRSVQRELPRRGDPLPVIDVASQLLHHVEGKGKPG